MMEFNHTEIMDELIEHSPDLIMILNIKGEYVFANETCASQLFGLPKQEIVGHHFVNMNMLTPESLQFCIEIFPSVIEGKTMVIQLKAINHEGNEVTLSTNCKLFSQNGKTYLYLIMRDITKEYIWEKEKGELLEYNHLLSETINQLGLGVIITDPKLKDNPIIYINEGLKNMTGSVGILSKNSVRHLLINCGLTSYFWAISLRVLSSLNISKTMFAFSSGL
jgi:PAS domain S-box-containing protein